MLKISSPSIIQGALSLNSPEVLTGRLNKGSPRGRTLGLVPPCRVTAD